MKNKLLKDLYDCFYTPLELPAQKQEIEECHKALIDALDKPERRLVLQIIGPGGKFCVSVFRQNQEYHVINVHSGAYSTWLHLSRKVGSVCAPHAA